MGIEKEKAFANIMGAVDMPPDNSPEYDEWLFNKTWEAAKGSGQPDGLTIALSELAEWTSSPLAFQDAQARLNAGIGKHVEVKDEMVLEFIRNKVNSLTQEALIANDKRLANTERESGELSADERLEAVNLIAKAIWPEAEWDGEQENANIAAIKTFHALLKQFDIRRRG